MAASSHIDFRGRRVLVVGDLMLDEIVRGEVTRISPEAPVPVLEVKERSAMPGGAANAAANIASLGGAAFVMGVVGDDTQARTMRSLLEASTMDASGLVTDATRPTTVKTRIVARNQQMVRIDHEARGPFRAEIAEKLLAAIRARIDDVDACIVSDYGKGVITPELVAALVDAAKGKPIVVDPKRRDFAAYRGATVLTPNLGELDVASGKTNSTTEEILASARALLPTLGGAAILVTRGADGMTLVKDNTSRPTHEAARARAVFDVTGAGDTVVGTLTLALASGLAWAEALHVASAAAAIAVSKPGTATVSIDELRAELEGHKT